MFSLKIAFRDQRGFTLIELLVVIVIIGILATTLLPKIMGAPAQARDVGRVANLKTLTGAFQLYYNGNNTYPSAQNGECLDPNVGVAASLVEKGYMQKNNFPKDPTKNNTTGGKCIGSESGMYYYKSLKRSGIEDNAFVLLTDVELDDKANSVIDCLNDEDVEDIDQCVANGRGTATGTDAVYIELGGI